MARLTSSDVIASWWHCVGAVAVPAVPPRAPLATSTSLHDKHRRPFSSTENPSETFARTCGWPTVQEASGVTISHNLQCVGNCVRTYKSALRWQNAFKSVRLTLPPRSTEQSMETQLKGCVPNVGIGTGCQHISPVRCTRNAAHVFRTSHTRTTRTTRPQPKLVIACECIDTIHPTSRALG